MLSERDKRIARALAMSLWNSKTFLSNAAIIVDGVADEFADTEEFKELVAYHLGLDFFDEMHWKEPRRFKEMADIEVQVVPKG